MSGNYRLECMNMWGAWSEEGIFATEKSAMKKHQELKDWGTPFERTATYRLVYESIKELN